MLDTSRSCGHSFSVLIPPVQGLCWSLWKLLVSLQMTVHSPISQCAEFSPKLTILLSQSSAKCPQHCTPVSFLPLTCTQKIPHLYAQKCVCRVSYIYPNHKKLIWIIKELFNRAVCLCVQNNIYFSCSKDQKKN